MSLRITPSARGYLARAAADARAAGEPSEVQQALDKVARLGIEWGEATVAIDAARYRNAASALRNEIETSLAEQGEDITEGNQELLDNLASAKTLEALFGHLLGEYEPNGTLLHSLMTDVEENY